MTLLASQELDIFPLDPQSEKKVHCFDFCCTVLLDLHMSHGKKIEVA